MIVVDTNVLLYLYLPGEHTAEAVALQEADPDWVAPILWRSEFRNALVGAVRRGEVTLDGAIARVAEVEDLLDGREHAVESTDVLGLAHKSGCSAYDCEFVSLAIQLGVPLVTMDSQVLKAFPRHTRPLTRAHRR